MPKAKAKEVKIAEMEPCRDEAVNYIDHIYSEERVVRAESSDHEFLNVKAQELENQLVILQTERQCDGFQ